VLADPTIARGVSKAFNLANIGRNLNTPPGLQGLQSFNLCFVTNRGAQLDSPKLSGAGFEFIVNDQFGAVYQIEVANGIGTGWSYLATVTNAFGKLLFLDPAALTNAGRHYRAVRP
jgi:hypothetical protein